MRTMKKLSNFVWLLAIALTTTFTFTSCGNDKDEPVDKNKVKVNPAKVFVNGMLKAMGGYVYTLDAEGRVSSIVNKKEKEKVTFEYKSDVLGTTDVPNVVMTVTDDDGKTVYKLLLNEAGYVRYCDEYKYQGSEIARSRTWNLEYNSDSRLVKAVRSVSGFQTTYTLTYKNGDATESSTVSQKEGKVTNHYQIFYTSSKVTSPIANKGCIMFFDKGLGINLEDLEYAYYAGMLGKATKHLTMYNLDKYNDKTSFDWVINESGFPTKVVVNKEGNVKEIPFVW